jgi:hypothetical protein
MAQVQSESCFFRYPPEMPTVRSISHSASMQLTYRTSWPSAIDAFTTPYPVLSQGSNAMAPRSGVDKGNLPAAGSYSTPGFKRLHRNAPLPAQEMNTIEQARRVLDRAFTATIAKIAAVQCNHERASGAFAGGDRSRGASLRRTCSRRSAITPTISPRWSLMLRSKRRRESTIHVARS